MSGWEELIDSLAEPVRIDSFSIDGVTFPLPPSPPPDSATEDTVRCR